MLPDGEELTPAERSAFAGLTREHLGSAVLEDRVVEALRDQGLLYDESPTGRAPRWWRGVTFVAAGLVLFVTGVLVGRQPGRRPVPALGVQPTMADTMSTGQLSPVLQRVGSEYVALLSKLPASDTVTAAYQVARSTLMAAAAQLARRLPADVVRARLASGGGSPPGRTSAAMIVF